MLIKKQLRREKKKRGEDIYLHVEEKRREKELKRD
jgi:hypothetical protein